MTDPAPLLKPAVVYVKVGPGKFARADHIETGEAPSMQSKGGHARAAKLSPERRREIALKASHARWKPDQPAPAPPLPLVGFPTFLLATDAAAAMSRIDGVTLTGAQVAALFEVVPALAEFHAQSLV